MTPLPVTIIGGYLGAGKTTLVNHLLRHAAGQRLAVLVNDFGALPIDADLIESVDGDVIGIAGGCVCCSYGSDLIAALEELGTRAPRPDRLLIETSGVGLPGAVAAAVTLLPGHRIDAILVLADAETVEQRAGDRYMGDTVRRQLHDADLIVLNKTDLVDAPRRAALRAWLDECAPGRPVIECVAGQLPAVVAFGTEAFPIRTDRPDDNAPSITPAARPAHSPGYGRLHASVDSPEHAARFTTTAFVLEHPVDAAVLAQSIAALRPAPLRAKGIIVDTTGRAVQLHVVGARWRVDPVATPPDATSRLVVIDRADVPRGDCFAALVGRARS